MPRFARSRFLPVLLAAASVWAIAALPAAGSTASQEAAALSRRDVSGSSLDAALRAHPWARVVVALRRQNFSPYVDGVAAVQRSVLDRLGSTDFRLGARWSSIPAFAGSVSRSGLAKLQRDPRVLRVDLDLPGRTTDSQSLPLIRGDVAHTNGHLGAGATVAVLDTGVDATHPDLVQSLVDQHCFCTNANGSGCCPNNVTEAAGAGSGRDGNGHGTNVTGIIASAGNSTPVGVAPSAKVVAVKVVDDSGVIAGMSQVVSGLNWVLTNHPEVRVVNLSLGSTALFQGACDSADATTLALASAVNQLRAHGTLVFAASGNAHSKTSMSAPGCIDKAVSVGAVYDSSLGSITFGQGTTACTDATTAADLVTCFSNSSPALDLLAPGALITSTGLNGGTSTYAGTSQACPHAAGAAAVIFGTLPGAAADDVESALESTGTKVTDASNGRITPRIDVEAALESLDSTPLPIGPPPPPSPPGTPPPPPSRAPKIDVSSRTLDFGGVRTRRVHTRVIGIRNLGNLALHVGLLDSAHTPFRIASWPGPFTIQAGGTTRVTLVFRPRAAGSFSEKLVIPSDDAGAPRIDVMLKGVGVRRASR